MLEVWQENEHLKAQNFFQPALSLIAVYLLAQSQFNAIMSLFQRSKLLECEHLRHISIEATSFTLDSTWHYITRAHRSEYLRSGERKT